MKAVLALAARNRCSGGWRHICKCPKISSYIYSIFFLLLLKEKSRSTNWRDFLSPSTASGTICCGYEIN